MRLADAPPAVRYPAVRYVEASRFGVAETSAVAEETPIAFRFGGVDYAVMMATPADIEDFTTGFAVTEGIAGGMEDIRAVEVQAGDECLMVDVTLSPARFRTFLADHRVRSLRGHTSCGVCGLESTHLLAHGNRKVAHSRPPSTEAIHQALASLHDLQPLACETRAAHAAAWCDGNGKIIHLREDIGRHNALDKLIGAGLRASIDTRAGFCLITSRCSFEMVQKAVAAGMSTLVAISAPTGLAVRTARQAGLTLLASARNDGHTLFA